MKKSLLLTPGPVPIPDFVQKAITQPVIHHRTAEFEAFYEDLMDDFRYLFQTKQHVCSMIGSGTYGVEVAMYSLFREKEEILVLNNGKFSERWADYGRLLNLDISEIKKEWGRGVNTKQIMDALERMNAPKGIVITHSETSTGVCIDLEEITFAIRQIYPDLLIVVDAITAVGAIPFYFDQWDVDCAIVSSQKALLNPAGTVIYAVSERGKNAMIATHPADFRNLSNYLQWAEKRNYPYTPPVSLLFGLKAAITYIRSETLPKIWNQTHQAAKYFRQAIVETGGQVFAESPSDSLTAFTISDVEITLILQQLEKEYEMKLSGGQGHLKGKIGRISHMGLTDKAIAEKCVGALKNILTSDLRFM